METKKHKTTGVLDRLVKNIDPESLDKTRREMLSKDEYTNFLIEQFLLGEISIRDAISRAMMYVEEHLEQKTD